jgi:ABC-type branched-subunit amino acid transport system ATPase component/ABC-type branched-subunit amino acid transport system permease subunit
MLARIAKRKTTLAMIAFLAAVIVYPLVFTGFYNLGLGVTAGALAAGTVGFVLLLGYAHQLAIGQPAFCMVGGYANAILCVKFGWDPLAALLVGIVLSMAIAYVVAAPILRLRGFVLAMGSLALHLILIVVALEVPFTGGALGTYGLPRFALFGLKLPGDLSYYYVVWVFVLGAIAIGLNIDRSRIGRALKAIAASEMAAGSVGIDITRYKVQMFVVSAGMASVLGSLLVHHLRAMDPTVFGFTFSLNLITAVIIGGLLSIWGGAIGAAVVTGLREVLRELSLPLWESVIMGALTVIVLIAFRRGFAGLISDIYDRIAGTRPDHAAVAVDPDVTALAPIADAVPDGTEILKVEAASRSFGSLRAVGDVSFTVTAGRITALIGPNGAGKTTLFNLISGYQPLDHGRVTFEGRSVEKLLPNAIALQGIGRTFQNLQLFDNMTVLDNVMCGGHRLMSAGILEISTRLPKVSREEAATREAAIACLNFVGLKGVESFLPGELSFGHQRLVEIARALALEPKLLLMDEPASGLNDTETEMLAELVLRIAALGITVLLVEHDMRLVMGLADHVVVMHHGEKIADGPTDQVRKDPQVIAAYLGQEAHGDAA